MYLRYLCRPDSAEVFSLKRPQRFTLQVSKQSGKPVLKAPGVAINDPFQSKLGDSKIDLENKDIIRPKLEDLNHVANIGNIVGNVKNVNIDGNVNSVGNIKLKETDVQITEDNNQLAINNNLPKDGYKYDDEYENKNIENVEGRDGTIVDQNAEIREINDDGDNNDEYDNDDDEDDEYDNDIGNYPVNRDDGGQYDDKPFNDAINGGNSNDYEDDDNDNGGYDKLQDNGLPHIHARNIGNAGSKDYERKMDSANAQPVKDYDDDEEVDDYAYDDDEDEETEKHRQDVIEDKRVIAKTNQGISNLHTDHTQQIESLSYSAFFMMSAICIVLVFILWRCLRKRRLRLRVGHKYFHV